MYNNKEFEKEGGVYFYGARLYAPVIGRWAGVDPLAEKYPAWSTFNYVLGNPISNIDPDGRLVILGGSCENIDEFIDLINKNFDGRLIASTEQVYDKAGNVIRGKSRLKIDIVGGVKNFSNLPKGAQNFYKTLDFADRVDEKVNIEIVNGDPETNVATGNFAQQKIDVADLKQWPLFDQSKSEQPGATQAGKVAHEVFEQTEKQAFRTNINDAHEGGIGVENKVNQNTRVINSNYIRGKVSQQKFIRSDGSFKFYRIDYSHPVIKVTSN